ncbi:hypothetical protein GCM10010297_35130 [Streptomyces malachitofuscus]|nr:hypothetical protein GCM10010297_35130 [Streptomyces malachitofuscus]
MTAHDEAEYDGMDALMAALLDEPLPEEARRDPAFLAGHAAAVADLALLREQLTAIGDALAGPGDAAPSGRHTAAHPGKRPATDPGPARTTGPHPPATPEPENPTTSPVPLSPPPARPGTGQEPGAVPQPAADPGPGTPPGPRGGPETAGEGLEPVVGQGAGAMPGLRGGVEPGDVPGAGEGPQAGEGLGPVVGQGAGAMPGLRGGVEPGDVPGAGEGPQAGEGLGPVVGQGAGAMPGLRGGVEPGDVPGAGEGPQAGEGLAPVVAQGAGAAPGLRGGAEPGAGDGPQAGEGLAPLVGRSPGTSPGPRVGPGSRRRVGGHRSRGPGPYRARRRGGKAVLGGLVAAAAAGFVLGMGWLVSQGGVGGAEDSAGRKAAADSKEGGGVAFGGPGYLACAGLVAEGSVAAVDQVPGAPAGTERVTVRVSRYYKGEGEVTFLQDVVEATPLSPGDRVLVGMPLDGDRPDAVIVGEAEIARERARIIASLPASRSLTCG